MNITEITNIFRRLYKEHIKKYLSKILWSLILSVIVAASTSATAWLLDPAVKKIFIEKDKTLAWLIPILIIITFFTKGFSLYLARINVIKVGNYIAAELQKKVSENILFADLQTLDNRHSGKYISNITYDCGLVTNLASTFILNLMKDSLSLVALIGLMFYQNWKLASFALLMMPLAVFFAKNLGKRVGKVQAEAGEISGNLNSFLLEIFKAAKMIRVYQKEENEKKNTFYFIDKLVDKNIKIASVMIRSQPIMETLTGIMIAGFIFYSGNLINAGELGINNFFSFLAAMMLAYQPIRSLATLNMVAYQGATAAKRIYQVLDQKIQTFEEKKLPDLNVDKCNIKFENITFHYLNTNKKAVKNINLNIRGGTVTAFVGHSGAGKSTIINLLPRFYDPQEGKIFIDNQDIHKKSIKSLRKYLSLVSQDIVLFDKTIKENVSYANEDATDKDIMKACEFAAASEFIENLPNKYETLVGENGVRLSGGQKQRISIARAILKKAPIILLDEATSSLDSDSEKKVQDAIANLTKNKTTLVIAHRLTTIHNADLIYVLKNGLIVSSGNHDYLIKNSEDYKALYQKQIR